eukprot:CAMPEP_0172710224 /NCGR_PEP_ID=MMETSP1074-20121228/55532_1 /TAXON_ID=2916 /ORGANISM="Ceratium fusus, Strain PA161109" /LENGTH=68 /DNA_ID=CAMNT_0013533589 /DNA_START=140 /DNA_END=346 /DNA_ORIENTATION=+
MLQKPMPGVLPAGMEQSKTQQQHLPVYSIQPSSQQLPVSVLHQMQHSFPSNLRQGSLPPGELQPTPQQ